jgi:hypothetical protein
VEGILAKPLISLIQDEEGFEHLWSGDLRQSGYMSRMGKFVVEFNAVQVFAASIVL